MVLHHAAAAPFLLKLRHTMDGGTKVTDCTCRIEAFSKRNRIHRIGYSGRPPFQQRLLAEIFSEISPHSR